MGWSFTQHASKQDVINELIRDWENEKYATKILEHSTRGNVVWAIVEQTNKETKVTDKFIMCALLSKQRNYGWGYKMMDESVHPYYYSVPLSYLKKVPVACQTWRDKVIEEHEAKKSKKFFKDHVLVTVVQ